MKIAGALLFLVIHLDLGENSQGRDLSEDYYIQQRARYVYKSIIWMEFSKTTQTSELYSGAN